MSKGGVRFYRGYELVERFYDQSYQGVARRFKEVVVSVEGDSLAEVQEELNQAIDDLLSQSHHQTPSWQEYRSALERLDHNRRFDSGEKISEQQISLLKLHGSAPEGVIVVEDLAHLAELPSVRALTGQYNKLGQLLDTWLCAGDVDHEVGMQLLADSQVEAGALTWRMRPEVSKALKQLGWIDQ